MEGRTGIFIQARANSSRLPGKIFERLQPDRANSSVLETICERLSGVPNSTCVVLIPDNDPQLRDWCQQRGLQYFAGSEHDVRDRYRKAAERFGVDVIVRATGDNPCVDPEIAAASVQLLRKDGADLMAYANLPLGIAVEVFRRSALDSDAVPATLPHREHVSLHIKHHPERFRVDHRDHWFTPPRGTVALPRLTVDTPQDLAVVRRVFAELGPDFYTSAVLELYRQRPELFAENASVAQRTFEAVSA